MWVIFVRNKYTGKTEVHDTTFSHRESKKAFKTAEERTDIDHIRMEMFIRNPPLGERTPVQGRTFASITKSFGYRVSND